MISIAVKQSQPQEEHVELLCLREACGAILPPHEAYFCSQRCHDLYEEPDVSGFTDTVWQGYWANYFARMQRTDRIRQDAPDA